MPGKPVNPDDDDEAAIEEIEWFDDWCVVRQELLDANDYGGLIKHCQLRVERDPDDLHGLEALAYAYLDAGEPQRAIAVVEERYRADPEHPLYETVIADALRAQGQPLEAFSWVRPPQVVCLDREVLDRLHRFLKPKRKPRSVCELWLEASGADHPFFSEADLLAALQGDGRFQVEDPESLGSASVSVR